VKAEMPSEGYLEERVVVDGQVITSRSPGTAMEFAFALVRALFGEDKVEEVNAPVFARL
jgi:4-methyl-5(b-hydroxyethyl)-thiazole monophosphate biosynthesis